MHILIDTNILFSALICEGNERLLIEKAAAQGHTVIVTDLIIEEIQCAVDRKLPQSKSRKARSVLKLILNKKQIHLKTAEQYFRLIAKARKYINKKDAPILAAGLQKEIDAIVSGDSDFIKNPKLSFLRKEKIFTTKEALNTL